MRTSEQYFRQEQERLRNELRLLLSWCMKVQATESPMQPAQKAVKAWRAKLQARSDEVMVSLGEKRNQLHKLPEALAEKSLTVDEVNEKSRELHETILRHQAQIAVYQHFFEIGNVDQVGGFIDLPLSAYPKKFRTGMNARWHKLSSADRIAVMAAGMCLLVLPLLALFMSHWGVDVFFSIDVNTTYDEFTIYCKNSTPRQVYVSPDAGQQAIQRENAEVYLITLYGKTSGNSTFQALPIDSKHWRSDGKSLASGRPVVLDPGEEKAIQIPLKPLRTMMPDIRRIQIKCAPQYGVEDKVLESAL